MAPFVIGSCHVDPSRLVIKRPKLDEKRISPRAMAVLVALAEANGEVVQKHDLMDAVWPRAEVTEGVLSQTVLELRNALGDDARAPQFIETIRSVGFRLMPAVTQPAGGPQAAGYRWAWRSRPRIWTGIGAACIATAIVWIYAQMPAEQDPPTARGPPRIIVMPFEDLSPEGGYDYFAAGIADEIALQLAASPRLRVVSDKAIRPLAARGVEPADIATRLVVDLMLTGSVQRRGHEVKLVARLTDAHTAEELWITRWNRPLGDVFSMQDEVAGSIAAVVLRGEALPDRVQPTDNLTAYDLYLQGRDHQKRIERAASTQAGLLFERALELDPSFAHARAELAETWALKGFIFQEGDQALFRALREAEAAIAMDSTLADAFYAKALALMGFARFAEARAVVHEAVRLAPNNADALFLSASLADARGDLAEAVRDHQLALKLNPTLARTVALGRLHYLLGDAELGAKVARRGHLLAPGHPTLYLAHLMTLMERHDDAESLCDLALSMHLPRARNLCGFSALVAGRENAAASLLREDWENDPRAQWGPFTFAASATHLALLEESSVATALLDASETVTQAAIEDGNDHWALRYNMAAIAAQRDDSELAREWFSKAYREGFRDYRLLHVDPALEPVRANPWFVEFNASLQRELIAVGAELDN